MSAEEGSMFASAEYLLSGIPVVNTKNIGGRNTLFHTDYVKTVKDDSEEIANAVAELKHLQINPHEIRNRTIRLMINHRQSLINLIQTILDKHNVKVDYSKEWPNIYTHKLGIRTHVPFFSKQRKRILKENMKFF